VPKAFGVESTTLEPGELAAASSFLSSRWSRDNLVTMRPGRLYDGRVLERIEPEALEYLVQDLEQHIGKIRVGAGRMGVLTWDIDCESTQGHFVLQVPRVLDERGSRERAVRDVPAENLRNMRHFRERGLSRFVAEPREFRMLDGRVPAALFGALSTHHQLGFGQGSIQLELYEGRQTFRVGLGASATAEVLAELVAALVYHYEADVEGGTAVADVCINDGDFAIKRRLDGAFELRLTALRRREPGINPSLLILYLIQLLAYEDWTVDGQLVGLPTLMSNPAVAFAGLVRGLRYHERDLGHAEERGETTALGWIREFGHSREGRAYRPWVERFLAGRLPLSFGVDLREHWWRVIPLERKFGLLELRGRLDPASTDATSARAVRSFLDRIAREIGRSQEDEPGSLRINDLSRVGIEGLLSEAQLPSDVHAAVAARIFEHWPYRSLDHLLGRVPEARGLRRLKSRIDFGHVVAEADQGTLRGLAPFGKRELTPRRFANREIFGGSLAESLHAMALRTFPTFEVYMDSVLHDPRWGYYARNVVIGNDGHFATNPELLSPHYGRWIAGWAFQAWSDMLAHGELSLADPFPIIEFGAGNGRLARDVLDAIRERVAATHSAEHAAWSSFAARARYHIYETSESLRLKQRQLLGDDASIAAGDARRPGETLKRDFPSGLRGFVITNEVPDAFGVHKVALTSDGQASAALVVPRVEKAVCDRVSPELARRIAAADESVRANFGFTAYQDEFYLDREIFFEALEASSVLAPEQRERLLSSFWFEELYVPIAAVPVLADQLVANAAEYALALAVEDSGVVLYVNTHATRFMRELGVSLAAGFVVTIDYGDTTFGLVQGARHGDFPFRVYRDSPDYRPRPNDPYAASGTQDMTADVNFTELARAGRDAGLEVVHFGPERDVTGGELPELLRAAADQVGFAEFLGNPTFKVLVLGTRASQAFVGPLSSPLSLSSREQDVPKARRPRIATIERALSKPR
jgi:SAM-dependent MidA family methyltransferase